MMTSSNNDKEAGEATPDDFMHGTVEAPHRPGLNAEMSETIVHIEEEKEKDEPVLEALDRNVTLPMGVLQVLEEHKRRQALGGSLQDCFTVSLNGTSRFVPPTIENNRLEMSILVNSEKCTGSQLARYWESTLREGEHYTVVYEGTPPSLVPRLMNAEERKFLDKLRDEPGASAVPTTAKSTCMEVLALLAVILTMFATAAVVVVVAMVMVTTPAGLTT
ncbi:hypothetical protein F5Y16DRAFT_398172 [Xylariaceae sp. FL0255]|nr:hypothetical protein F5Y16DRAFT_398172 [Xylariaceae sp. FL0255]